MTPLFIIIACIIDRVEHSDRAVWRSVPRSLACTRNYCVKHQYFHKSARTHAGLACTRVSLRLALPGPRVTCEIILYVRFSGKQGNCLRSHTECTRCTHADKHHRIFTDCGQAGRVPDRAHISVFVYIVCDTQREHKEIAMRAHATHIRTQHTKQNRDTTANDDDPNFYSAVCS